MSKSDAFNQSLLDYKQQLAKKLMAGFTIFCTIALPISLSRWPEIGFQFVFIHHILLTIISYLCFFRPNKTNYKIDLFVIISLLTSMMISGTLSFGLQSGAVTFAVFCVAIIALGWGFIAALVYALSWCTYLIAIGYLFANSYIEYSINPNEYGDSIGAWVIVALCSSLITIWMLVCGNQGISYFSRLIEKIEQQKVEIEQLANTDSLTGFSTARLAMPLLSQAISLAQRERSNLAVVFVDLNGFKKVNDTYGHDAGDSVLQETSRRIRNVLRDMDIACRIGGDEFLFIIPKVKDAQEIKVVLQRVIDTWSVPIRFQNAEISITASIGVAMFPQDASTAKELRQKADVAMYYAKHNDLAIKFYA